MTEKTFHSITCGSLNIHGINRKIQGNLLQPVVHKYDLFSAVETWHTIRSNLHIDGYSYYSNPAMKHSKKGRGTGGVVFYFKQKLASGLHLLGNANKYCMWIRLDSDFFGLENDLYMGIIYLRYTEDAKTRDLYFEQLDDDIVKFRSMGDIVLTGDFNARTSTTPDYVINDQCDTSDSHLPLSELYVHDIPLHRNNHDRVCNQYGKLLLDICCNHGIRILNGRLTGDLFGNFTYFSENNTRGASTIDYTIASVSIIDRFKFLHVSEPNLLLSDHCLLSFGIRGEYSLLSDTDPEMLPLYDKFEWDQSSGDNFITGLLENTTQEKMCNFLTKAYSCENQSIDQATHDLTNIIIDVGNSNLKRIVKSKSRKSKKKKQKAKLGFDTECYNLRKEVRSLGRAVRRNPYNLNLREKFVYCSHAYKKLLKRKEREAHGQLLNHLCSLESKDPKQFWKLVNKMKNSDQQGGGLDIHPDQWVNHFNQLYNCTPDASLDKNSAELENEADVSETLSRPFTIREIKKHIQLLKNNKASASDMVLNEMIKKGAFILLPLFCKLFNLILDCGAYPSLWNMTYQVPIFKSGNRLDCNNYRGIAINSCLGKLFTKILQARLLNYVEQNDKLSENQAGFRPGRSTSDHLFVIKSLVNKYLKLQKKTLYCCFIDFSKAFDTVWRNGMFLKLLQLGTNGKFYRIIKNMYSNTLTSIKLTNGISDSFRTTIGIKQGDGLSPLLFCLYIDDLNTIFNESCDPCTIGNIRLNHLLYADDLVLFSETKQGLQNSLNKLNEYCIKWKLKINYNKSKVVVFRPSGRLTGDSFNISGTILECVNKYKYLGLLLTSNGSFISGVQELVNKGQKAWYSLRSAIHIDLLNNPAVILKLFDSMIKPIITYGCEIWQQQFYKSLSTLNVNNCDRLPFEKLHNRVCKQIIGVGKYSSNIATRTELGRLPISEYILKQTVNYWSKLMQCKPNSLLYQSLLSEKELDSRGLITWYTSIKNVVNLANSNNADIKGTMINGKTQIKKTYEQNSIDFIKGETGRNANENNKLRTYAHLCNNTINMKPFHLHNNLSWHLKKSLSKFRIGDHNLRIETGRHVRPKIKPEERICPFCDYVEDEVHFLVNCHAFEDIRIKYNISSSGTSNSQDVFVSLLNSTDINISANVAKYLNEAFEKRKTLLLDM